MATDYSKQQVLGIIQREAQERGIPKDDFLRFAYIETGGRFDEQASRGPNGAKGLFQFVPSTAAQYGISGRELDAVANTDAAARLYLDNKSNLTSHHAKTGQPYLSGQPQPNGLDMYMAHQQGSAGYHSIQAGIATGSFTRSDTRPHILNNVSARDIQQVTGMSMEEFKRLPDKQMGETFVKYWDTKYRNISIPEVGVQPLGQGGQGQSPGAGGQTQDPKPAQNQSNWPAPGNYKINDADKPGEGHGEFGTSRGGGTRTHKGVDIEGKVGDPIESFRPGTVIAVKPNNGAAGNMVTIDHGNGLTSTYMHLDKIHAKVGQKVPEDIEVIGTMGRTGNTPKAGDTHLHFEIRKNGEAVDPMPYLKGAKDLDFPAAAKTELKHGDKGAQVEQLQTRLSDLGYTDAAGKKLKPDSDFGDRTKEAVEQFQRENGMKVTGVADKETMRLVEKGMTRHAAADGELKPGEKGPDVRGLQQNLIDLKMTGQDGKPLKVDGDFGDNTREAVRKFQEANGLPQTGTADKTTLERVGQVAKFEPKIDADARITGVAPQDPPRAPAARTTDQPAATQPPTGHDHTPDRTPREPAAPTTQTPQINQAGHPDNKLYTQALSNLEQMGPNGGFKSRDEMERAAGALAADAKLSGLTQIDHVTRSKNGEGLIAVQGNDPWAPDAKRAFLDVSQAANQSVDQSTRIADAKRPDQTVAPQPNQPRNEMMDTPVQKDETQTKPKSVMV